MKALDRLKQLLNQIDPNDPFVAEEIRKGIRHPYGITDIHDHLTRLHTIAHGNVMEIGVRFGSSTAALLSGVEVHGGHLFSVDIADCPFSFESEDWTFIRRDSRDTEYLNTVIPAKLDVLFVDGDHTYEGVLADLKNFGPRADYVFCHDVNLNENPQVLQAIETYLLLNGTQKLLTIYPESHGLAMLR